MGLWEKRTFFCYGRWYTYLPRSPYKEQYVSKPHLKSTDDNASNNIFHMSEICYTAHKVFSRDMTVKIKTLHIKGSVFLHNSKFSSKYREGNSNQNITYDKERCTVQNKSFYYFIFDLK